MKEAILYQKLGNGQVLCQLCAHYCQIARGKQGVCRVRENRDGRLYTSAFGRTVSKNVDPIEKKPLFHFFPGSTSYSIATHGCNFHCQYCTNWQVSQLSNERFETVSDASSPEQIIDAALRAGCESIAYTYVEPTIFFEYLDEIARLARAAGLLNVFKTNGFMTPEMLKVARPYLDAANVDLKAFQEKTYQSFGGALHPVLDSLKMMKAMGVWLEISTLVIPGINDEPTELANMANFIVQELGTNTPWHIARFFPAYGMEHLPPTPVSTLHEARNIGWEAGLRYVYLANLLEQGSQDTHCHHCGYQLVKRRGQELLENRIEGDRCPACHGQIPGCFGEPVSSRVPTSIRQVK